MMLENRDIKRLNEELSHHSIYNKIQNLDNLRIFMKYHVFAVWDFMSLLKSLQRQITCVSHPWHDSPYSPHLVRLINEIVLGEESDLDQNGQPSSHFALYLKAMREIGADTNPIENFIKTGDTSLVPETVREMTQFHLDIAEGAQVHEVASSFFFGREKLIPSIFQPLVSELEASKLDCPTLIYYLQRHIELDGDEHGPKALQCLEELTDTEQKSEEAVLAARLSLQWRQRFWDFIEQEITLQEVSHLNVDPQNTSSQTSLQ